MSETFHPTVEEASLSAGSAVGLIVNDWPVVLCLSENGLSAMLNRCTHAASELSSGRVRRGMIMCPLHGARFELSSGRCIGGAYRPLMTFKTRVVDGCVEVAVPDEAPGPEHRPVPTLV